MIWAPSENGLWSCFETATRVFQTDNAAANMAFTPAKVIGGDNHDDVVVNWISKVKTFLAPRLAAVTVMLAVLSGFSWLGHWHWLADLCTHFRFHYAVAGLVLAIILALMGRYPWAMVAALVFGANAGPAIPYWQAPEFATAALGSGESIRILQFNVNKHNPRAAAIAAWLERNESDIDIAVLVETSPVWRQHLEGLRRQFPYQATELMEDNFGIVVLSRFAVGEVAVFRSQVNASPGVRLVAETPKLGIPFVLYAAHPPPPISALLSRLRNRQLLWLGRKMAAEPLTARILVGDLNTTVWSVWYRRMAEFAGLRNAQFGEGYAGTWPNLGIVPGWLGIPIDHVLVSGNIRAERWSLGPAFGSDHVSVVTKLTLLEANRNDIGNRRKND